MVKIAEPAGSGKKVVKANKKAAKKTAPVKGAKKAKPVAAKVFNEGLGYGMERAHDVPMCQKKADLLTILKKIGEGSVADIVAASNGKLKAVDVRHYGYHARAGGLVEINRYPLDDKGFGGDNKWYFKLSKAGAKLDIKKALAEVGK